MIKLFHSFTTLTKECKFSASVINPTNHRFYINAVVTIALKSGLYDQRQKSNFPSFSFIFYRWGVPLAIIITLRYLAAIDKAPYIHQSAAIIAIFYLLSPMGDRPSLSYYHQRYSPNASLLFFLPFYTATYLTLLYL